MTDKICFKCNKEKPLDDFYKHPKMLDGHLNKCKECTKKDNTNNRHGRIDYYRAYDKDRSNLPHRVELRKRVFKEFKANNPEKRHAHIVVGNAIRAGILTKQPCSICGSTEVHGHHRDYSKPLDVVWLCPSHHKAAHSNVSGISHQNHF